MTRPMDGQGRPARPEAGGWGPGSGAAVAEERRITGDAAELRAHAARAAAGNGVDAPFEALRWTLLWVADALRAAAGAAAGMDGSAAASGAGGLPAVDSDGSPTTSSADAFRAVVELHAALSVGGEIGDALPAVLAAADAGVAAEDEVDRLAARLRRDAVRVRQAREELADRQARHRDLLDRDRENRAVEERLHALRRAEALADQIDDLRAQVDVLERRLGSTADEIADVEAAITGASVRLVQLTTEQIGRLDERTARELRRADANHRQLRELLVDRRAALERARDEDTRLAGEVEAAQTELTRLRDTHEDRHRALTGLADAGNAMSAGIGGLTEAAELLGRVDALLARSLADRERALRAARAVRFPGDD
ncbi:hypothetical protein [Frankia sp. QA3]|uniref:hypothetical protein n=1 Tax=Frankia sp. QA3 TaxID=710111 RepID=UPI000269C50E|nr:hypothetical protein [Frankia sp. QA3]EIV94362.1 hypothetical protein FraQA3DRAFT_4114 [Frankia sp. QA3]